MDNLVLVFQTGESGEGPAPEIMKRQSPLNRTTGDRNQTIHLRVLDLSSESLRGNGLGNSSLL